MTAALTHPSVAPRNATRVGKLAVFGGSRAVTTRFKERWKPIHLSDLGRIAMHCLRGRATTFGANQDVGAFEAEFCAMTQTRYAAAMNSGTATLHSAYVALGVRPGDEVIVPAYTFFASAGPILQCGATPVFCDVDKRSLTADPNSVEQLITEKTRAICAVHLWGNPAKIDRLVEIAKKHNLGLVEDCSHAHGATFDGRPVGGFGDIGCFSLQGSKPVSGGEAGVAVTNNPRLFDKLIAFGLYGRERDFKTDATDVDDLTLGIKYRPHLYSMVLARGGLKRLGELNRRRRANYQRLATLLEDCPAVDPIYENDGGQRGGMLEFIFRYRPEHAGNWSRGAFVNALKAEGVPIGPDRYTPLHQQKVFSTPIPAGVFGSVFAAGLQPKPIAEGQLRVTESVSSNLMTMPPFTVVKPAFIDGCAAAMGKVASAAPTISDFRVGN